MISHGIRDVSTPLQRHAIRDMVGYTATATKGFPMGTAYEIRPTTSDETEQS